MIPGGDKYYNHMQFASRYWSNNQKLPQNIRQDRQVKMNDSKMICGIFQYIYHTEYGMLAESYTLRSDPAEESDIKLTILSFS